MNKRGMAIGVALVLLVVGALVAWWMRAPTMAAAAVEREASGATAVAAPVVRKDEPEAALAADEGPRVALPPKDLPALGVRHEGAMAAPQFSDGLEPQRGGQVVAHAHMAVLGCMGRAQAAAPDAEIWIRIRASIAPDAQGRPALSTPELSASAGAPAELIDCARANLTARKIPIPPDTKGTFEVQFRPPPRGTPKRAVRKPIVKED